MIHLGLGQSDLQTLIETLSSSHRIRIVVDILDHDEKHRDTLTFPEARVIDGEVQMDTTGDVSRSLSLTLLDPLRKLPFDPNRPAQGGLFAGYFVQVKYGVWVDEASDWVEIPVFYGPLTSFEQTTETIQLEAQGKEALLLAPHYAVQGYSIQSGTRLDDAIKKVAAKMGETKFDIPDLSKHLPTDRVIAPKMEPWKVIQGGTKTAHQQLFKSTGKGKGHNILRSEGGDLLAVGDVDRHAFYDGHGRLCVRKKVDTPKFTFDEGWVTSPPTVTYDLEAFVNYVHVKGTKGKGAKTTPWGVATLLASHPFSAQSLGRNDKPRFIAVYLETQLTTDKDCQSRAQEILHQRAGTGVNASFSSLPMPLLEEGDRVRLETQDYDINFDLKQWSLPLTSTSDMSVGSSKRIQMRTPHWKRIRHKKHRRHHHHRHHHHRHHHRHGNG